MTDTEILNNYNFENVWYASSKYAEGHIKFIAFEKKGELKIISKTKGYSISFYVEEDVIFETNTINKVYRKGQGFPFFSYIFFTVMYLTASLAGGKKGLLYVLLMLIISLPLGIIFFYTQQWIVIEYTVNNKEVRQYLFDGRYKGWAGSFGGNREILNTIKTTTGL